MCVSKMSGGGGRVYLRGEFDGEEGDLRWPELEIVGGGSGNEERGRRRNKERKKEEEEERVRSNRYAPKGTSLDGVLL
jgi:hypothetical protein